METKEKKAPVDIKEIIARANEKTAKVNNSMEKIEAQKDTYRVLPDYPKYEFNGKIIRSVDKKAMLSFKTGTQKYQLYHKDGTRRVVSKEEIKAMFKDMPIKKLSIEKQPKLKKEKVIKEKKRLDRKEKVWVIIEPTKKEFKDIVNFESTKKEKIYNLHQAGATNKEIESYLGANQGWIWNVLNAYKKAVS